jgi:hypothetical protein
MISPHDSVFDKTDGLHPNVHHERVLQPWQEHPYRLISWLDMLEFSSHNFVWCATSLEKIKYYSYMASAENRQEPIFNPAANIDDETKGEAIKAFEVMEQELRKVGLSLTANTLVRIVRDLKDASRPQNYGWLITQSNTIRGLIDDELKDKVFFYIPADRAKYYLNESASSLVDQAVDFKFPSAARDIHESEKCYALGRNTACAFHAFRCLETGILALSRCLQIPDPLKDADRNWGAMLKKIKEAIDKRWSGPNDKRSGDGELFDNFYAALAAMRNPWRNATMHVEKKYTDEEAKHLLDIVKVFMVNLAVRIDETGDPKA